MAQMNHQENTNRLTDMGNRLVVAKGEGGGRGMNREFRVGRCKLLHLEWIHKKVLHRNYVQFLVIQHDGR